MKRTELAEFLQELSEQILNDPPEKAKAPMIDGRSIDQLQNSKIIDQLDKIENIVNSRTIENLEHILKIKKFLENEVPGMRAKIYELLPYTSDEIDYLNNNLFDRIKDLDQYLGRINSTCRIIHDGSHEFFKYQREFNQALHASILSLIKRVKDMEEILWYNVKPNTLPGKKEQNPVFNEDELQEMEQELPLTGVDKKLKDHADQYMQEKTAKFHEKNPQFTPGSKEPKKIHVELDCVICKRITVHIEVGDNLHCKECGNIGMSVDQFLRTLEKEKKEELESNEINQ